MTAIRMEYCWLSWEHKNRPFSAKTLEYIRSINIMEDIEILNSQYKFRPICLRNMRMSNTILKMGAAAGLTLGEIGKIWCRTDDEGEVPSIFERLVDTARRQADLLHDRHNDRLSPLIDFIRNGGTIRAPYIGIGKGLKKKGRLLPADTDTYEQLKEKEETKGKTTEKRERSNTMLEDVVPVGKISPLKAPLAEVQGLAVVTESEEEKLFSQGKDGSRKGSTASGNQEEEKVMMRKKASNMADEEEKDIKVDLPMLVRTASIPTKMAALSVFWSLSETRIEA